MTTNQKFVALMFAIFFGGLSLTTWADAYKESCSGGLYQLVKTSDGFYALMKID